MSPSPRKKKPRKPWKIDTVYPKYFHLVIHHKDGGYYCVRDAHPDVVLAFFEQHYRAKTDYVMLSRDDSGRMSKRLVDEEGANAVEVMRQVLAPDPVTP